MAVTLNPISIQLISPNTLSTEQEQLFEQLQAYLQRCEESGVDIEAWIYNQEEQCFITDPLSSKHILTQEYFEGDKDAFEQSLDISSAHLTASMEQQIIRTILRNIRKHLGQHGTRKISTIKLTPGSLRPWGDQITTIPLSNITREHTTHNQEPFS